MTQQEKKIPTEEKSGSLEELRIRDFEDRIRRIVLTLAKKVTSINKRIDEVLRTQKTIKERLEEVEDTVYKYLVLDIKGNDDTPIESIVNGKDDLEIVDKDDDIKEAERELREIQQKGKLDVHNNKSLKKIANDCSVQIAKKNEKTRKEINRKNSTKDDDRICLSCKHKVWKYSTEDGATNAICDFKLSAKFNKVVDYHDRCAYWSKNTYINADYYGHRGNSKKVFQKKIMAVDIISGKTIEEEIGE